MNVSKLGGAGTASEWHFRNINQTVIPYITMNSNDRNILVISAKQGATRHLMSIWRLKKEGKEDMAIGMLKDFYMIHRKIYLDLTRNKKILEFFDQIWEELYRSLFIDTHPHDGEAYASLLQYGEIIQSTVLSMYLNKVGVSNHWFDSRDFIMTTGNQARGEIAIEESVKRIEEAIPEGFGRRKLLVTPGFVSSHLKSGQKSILELDGSDDSAAIIAHAIEAKKMTFFKDICGVCVGNYQIPHDRSHFLARMTFPRFGEMFGGKKVYPVKPRSIEICSWRPTPTDVRSFLDPHFGGTEIR